MYRLGEKYQLPTLQECVIDKFKKVTDLEREPLSFLRAAKELYGTLADSDSIYAPFFLEKTEELLQQPENPASVPQFIREASSAGGKFAADVFTAQRNAFLTSQKMNQENARQLESFRTANKRWEKGHAEIKDSLEQIKANHYELHEDCEDCTRTVYEL